MIYDQNTGYLMLSSYIEGEENHLYAIHPETLLATQLGSFGEKVWPVVSLHQYERITDLTVKLSRATADLYVGDTMRLTAKVTRRHTRTRSHGPPATQAWQPWMKPA